MTRCKFYRICNAGAGIASAIAIISFIYLVKVENELGTDFTLPNIWDNIAIFAVLLTCVASSFAAIILLVATAGEYMPDKVDEPSPIFTGDYTAAVIILNEYCWDIYYFKRLKIATAFALYQMVNAKKRVVRIKYRLKMHDLDGSAWYSLAHYEKKITDADIIKACYL